MGVTLKDLGELVGDVLIFGGPYSNLQATTALLCEAERLAIAPASRICTGDIIAYCANPSETLARLSGACESVAGNCEKQLVAQEDNCGCGFDAGSTCEILSNEWYPFAQSKIQQSDRDIMAGFPDLITFHHEELRYAVVHGGYTDISRFIWPSSDADVFQAEISAIEQDVGKIDAVIAGHCGVAFERHINGVRWINPGAIGMPPHDGRTATRYVVLGKDGARIMRLNYDVDGAVCAMKMHGLTQGYHTALQTGIWPSEDVLPAEMRRT